MVEGQMLLLRSEMGHNRPSKKSGASDVCSEGLDKEQGGYEMWIFESKWQGRMFYQSSIKE